MKRDKSMTLRKNLHMIVNNGNIVYQELSESIPKFYNFEHYLAEFMNYHYIVMDDSYLSREETVITSLTIMNMITDLYQRMTLESKINNQINEDLLNTLEEKFKDIDKVIFNPFNIVDFIGASFQYEDASAYYKVLQTYALNDKEIEKLSSFNPFFMEEYEHYHVKVDRDFILRQIGKWINHSNDEITAYTSTSEFICNMYKIDSDLINDVLVELIEGYEEELIPTIISAIDKSDISSVNDVIENFYERNKDIKNKTR